MTIEVRAKLTCDLSCRGKMPSGDFAPKYSDAASLEADAVSAGWEVRTLDGMDFHVCPACQEKYADTLDARLDRVRARYP